MLAISAETLMRLRKQYPKGTRVELLEMDDPYRNMPKGMKGTVQCVDDSGSVHVHWENGSSLAALYGIDHIRKCD